MFFMADVSANEDFTTMWEPNLNVESNILIKVMPKTLFSGLRLYKGSDRGQ